MAEQCNTITIGLLPFYLALYDDCAPQAAAGMSAFTTTIAQALHARGLTVHTAEICRKAPQFAAAVSDFESKNVDAIVTLHLAYSPSLESIDALAGTDLPLVVMDTTPDADFGFDQNADRILFNHGIHGVQDMCNMLIRRGKDFSIEAGHWLDAAFMDRIIARLSGCHAASAMRSARVGLIGEPFAGMGDFQVPFATLADTIGMNVIQATPADIAALMPAADADEVTRENESDLKRFTSNDMDIQALSTSNVAGLAVRRWIDKEKLSAMTVNFLAIDGTSLPAMPFLEISKAMSRGIGYGGEGDVLTAALCSAISSINSATTFSEIFCPDWSGNKLFLSHMGEVNCDLLSPAKLIKKPFPYTTAADPAAVTGCLKAGTATLINLAPGPDNTFTLITAPITLCTPDGPTAFADTVHGWFTPAMDITDFLEAYSKAGGTHHLAISYDMNAATLETFANVMGWHYVTIT